MATTAQQPNDTKSLTMPQLHTKSRTSSLALQGTPYALNSELRRKMREKTSLSGGLELIDVLEAADGTRKLLLKATDGAAKGLTIQTVVIPMFKGATNARYTVCVSSQVSVLTWKHNWAMIPVSYMSC